MKSTVEKINESSSKDRYFAKRALVDIYKEYEIRKYEDLYVVDVSIGILTFIGETIDNCKEFIDTMVEHGIKQGDGEASMRYIKNNFS